MANQIPARYVENYQKTTLALKKKGQEQTAQALSRLNINAETNALRQAIIDLMQTMCGAYSDAAAAAAAEFYTVARRASIGGDFEALVESGRDPNATRIACLGIFGEYQRTGDLVSMITQLLLRVEYEISEAGAECMFANMAIDPYRER